MSYPVRELERDAFPDLITEIPDCPSKLYLRGELPPNELKLLAVVGSRNYTNYGKQVVEYLISGLRGYPVAIVSGLALGIDALAHTAALDAGLHTLAVPGSGIDDGVLYPKRNKMLAEKILNSGGGLLNEFDPTFKATPWSFPKRNRIMAGLAHAVLVVEAAEKSGTLITARLTAEYNRELLVVPADIFRESSRGSHQFLKLGATPVTSPGDILEVLNIEEKVEQSSSHVTGGPEQRILAFLSEPKERDVLIRELELPVSEASVLLMDMELRGLIQESGGMLSRLRI